MKSLIVFAAMTGALVAGSSSHAQTAIGGSVGG